MTTSSWWSATLSRRDDRHDGRAEFRCVIRCATVRRVTRSRLACIASRGVRSLPMFVRLAVTAAVAMERVVCVLARVAINGNPGWQQRDRIRRTLSVLVPAAGRPRNEPLFVRETGQSQLLPDAIATSAARASADRSRARGRARLRYAGAPMRPSSRPRAPPERRATPDNTRGSDGLVRAIAGTSRLLSVFSWIDRNRPASSRAAITGRASASSSTSIVFDALTPH